MIKSLNQRATLVSVCIQFTTLDSLLIAEKTVCIQLACKLEKTYPNMLGLAKVYLLHELVVALRLETLIVEEGTVGAAQVHEVWSHCFLWHTVRALLACPPVGFGFRGCQSTEITYSRAQRSPRMLYDRVLGFTRIT